MKVYIKNKVISLRGSSEVYDEENKLLYKVKGKLISCRKKKRIFDAEGNLVFRIQNRFFNFFSHKTYIFDNEKNKIATIKKGAWSLNRNYEILDTEDHMEIVGKIFSRHSQILRNDEQIATLSRQITFIGDSFVLEADEKEIPFLTALVIAYDNLVDKRREGD